MSAHRHPAVLRPSGFSSLREMPPVSRKMRLVTLALLALTIPLAGCGGILPKSEPLQIIAPQVHVAPDPSWPQVAWHLTVARPTANDMLDSRRMAVSPAPGQIQVYKGVAWGDTVPDIVQTAVVEAFEDSGKILAVGHQTGGLRVDYTLQLDMRDYQAVYRNPAGPPEVTLTIYAKLVEFTSSRAVASHTFREVVPASATSAPAVAQAFDSALASLVHDVVGWTLASGQQSKIKADESAPKR
jgi:cholesterol transport system auxiliary component